MGNTNGLKSLGLLFLLCLVPVWALAQTITVKGVVKDATGLSVIGASVLQQGTTNGTITDFDGNFTLEVPSDAVLTISFVGYKSQDIPVAGQTSLNINIGRRHGSAGRSGGSRLWCPEEKAGHRSYRTSKR